MLHNKFPSIGGLYNPEICALSDFMGGLETCETFLFYVILIGNNHFVLLEFLNALLHLYTLIMTLY